MTDKSQGCLVTVALRVVCVRCGCLVPGAFLSAVSYL